MRAVLALSGGLAITFSATVSATPAAAPPEVLKGNLVWNGGFDVGDSAGHPLGWTVDGNEAAANVVNLGAYRTSGLTSLQLADVEGSAVEVRSKRAVAVPGVEYSLSLDLKGQDKTTGTAPAISLQFWGMPPDMSTSQGPLLDEQVVRPQFSTGWQKVKLSAIPPVGTVQVNVRFLTQSEDSGTSYIDSAQLTEAPPAYDPKLGTDHELFVDNYRIESMDDVGRVLHPAEKSPLPTIVADQPWETSVYTYGSVVKPKGANTYRLYYTCLGSGAYPICLATSKDFKHWTKPDLGLVDFKGSKHNNIVTSPGGNVVYNPDAPADRRYSFLYFKNNPFGYHGMISADGLHFKPASDQPLLPGGDVVELTYDEVAKLYIATFKDRLFQSDTPGTYDRSAFIATSKDFLHWSPRTLAVGGEVADDGAAYVQGGLESQIYGMPTFRYGNQYLGIPWDLQTTDYTTGQFASAGDGPVVPGLASSRNLLQWDREVRGPLIESGDPGAWNDGALYTSTNLRVTDKTVELLYGGFNTWHGGALPPKVQKAAIGLATWRRDGFVSLTNAAAGGYGNPGSVTTKPFTFTGKNLYVNAKVLTGGELTVDVLDGATGEPIGGLTADRTVPVKGDRVSVKVHWTRGAKVAALQGKSIKLKFHMRGVELYSYWFGK